MGMFFLGNHLTIQSQKRRRPSPLIAGKGKTLGDVVHPIVNDQDKK